MKIILKILIKRKPTLFPPFSTFLSKGQSPLPASFHRAEFICKKSFFVKAQSGLLVQVGGGATFVLKHFEYPQLTSSLQAFLHQPLLPTTIFSDYNRIRSRAAASKTSQ